MTIFITLLVIIALGSIGLLLSFFMQALGLNKVFFSLYDRGFLSMKAPTFMGVIIAFWVIIGLVPAKSYLLDEEAEPEGELAKIEEVEVPTIKIEPIRVDEVAKFEPDFSKEKRVFLKDLEAGQEAIGKHVKTKIEFGKIDDRKITFSDKGALFPAKFKNVQNHPDIDLYAFFPVIEEQLNELQDYIEYHNPNVEFTTQLGNFMILDQDKDKVALQLNYDSLKLDENSVSSLQGVIKQLLQASEKAQLERAKIMVENWKAKGFIE